MKKLQNYQTQQLSAQEIIKIDGGVHGEDGGCIVGLPIQIGKIGQ